MLRAFELLELDSRDLRREPTEHRKMELAELLAGRLRSSATRPPGIALNEVFVWPGDVVFESAGARVRGHRQQAARVALRRQPDRRVAQNQEPECTRSAP